MYVLVADVPVLLTLLDTLNTICISPQGVSDVLVQYSFPNSRRYDAAHRAPPLFMLYWHED